MKRKAYSYAVNAALTLQHTLDQPYLQPAYSTISRVGKERRYDRFQA
jgi:hypothetical protein